MGMFSNYENIIDNYIPNNIKRSFPIGQSYTKLAPVAASKPFEEYDLKGNLVGYSWHQGETLNLEFNIEGEITVETSAIVLVNRGETPDQNQGAIGQRAYNITDLRSWTCSSFFNGKFIWVEDKEFTYPETSSRSIYLSAEDYIKDKQVSVVIYNFRKEPVIKKLFSGTSKVIFKITKEMSQALTKGIYYCELNVVDDNICLPIFTDADCTLLVK